MDESQRDGTIMAAVMSCSSLEASERRVSSRHSTHAETCRRISSQQRP
jgi:hypothetical protein